MRAKVKELSKLRCRAYVKNIFRDWEELRLPVSRLGIRIDLRKGSNTEFGSLVERFYYPNQYCERESPSIGESRETVIWRDRDPGERSRVFEKLRFFEKLREMESLREFLDRENRDSLRNSEK